VSIPNISDAETLTVNKFVGAGVLAAGAASGFFAWWGASPV
jgi:hypothetical protein